MTALERATLTVREAAEALGVSRDVLYESIRRGTFPALRLGKRVVISRVMLDRLLAGDVRPEH